MTLQRALEISYSNSVELDTEKITIDEAHGRILSEDIKSHVNDPIFDNSAMDGWAVRIEDCKIGSKLKIIGTSQAGKFNPPPVRKGEACKIMTGAPIPKGANSILIIENSKEENGLVTILENPKPNYIRKLGENITIGQTILKSGTLLSPFEISLAATSGNWQINVVKKPIVSIISTGDELVHPSKKLKDGEIFESNSFGISALIRKMGGNPVHFGHISDSMEELRKTLNSASEKSDLIITSGGVSMGEWDLVRKIMHEEGKIKFWKIKLRPGGPPLFGTWNNTPIFGLPGNPVSSHVVFISLVAPWLNKIMGSDENNGNKLGNRVKIRLKDPVKGAPGKICMRRIYVELEDDELVGYVRTHQGSGNINSLVTHNALTLLPPDTDGLTGQLIDAIWLC